MCGVVWCSVLQCAAVCVAVCCDSSSQSRDAAALEVLCKRSEEECVEEMGETWYGVATISRLLKIIGLFCKRALQMRRYSAKETYIFKEPTNRRHPIATNAQTHA